MGRTAGDLTSIPKHQRHSMVSVNVLIYTLIIANSDLIRIFYLSAYNSAHQDTRLLPLFHPTHAIILTNTVYFTFNSLPGLGSYGFTGTKYCSASKSDGLVSYSLLLFVDHIICLFIVDSCLSDVKGNFNLKFQSHFSGCKVYNFYLPLTLYLSLTLYLPLTLYLSLRMSISLSMSISHYVSLYDSLSLSRSYPSSILTYLL